MGKKSSLREDLVNWLKTHLSAFFQISEESNRAPWLAELTETTIEKFNLPFDKDVKTLEDYRIDIPRWFYNQAGSERRKRMRLLCSGTTIDLSSTVKPSKPLKLDSGVPHVPSARVIFGQKQAETINLAATARRTATGESHKTHVAHWNSVLTEEWKNLPEEERQKYYDEVEERKSKLLGPPSEEQIYSNQECFPAALQQSLQDYLGFDKRDQIGEAALHVQGIYRGEGDYLKSFSLVLLPPGAKTTEKFNTTAEYTTKFLNPWNDYGLKVLANTAYRRNELSCDKTSLGSASLIYDSEQAPLLPESPSDMAVLRMTLQQYILESWDHHWEGRDGKPSFSWPTFTSGFILPSCLPQGIVIEKLPVMGIDDIVTWYSHLYTLQQRLLEAGELQQFFRGHKHLKSLLSAAESVVIAQEMNHLSDSVKPATTQSRISNQSSCPASTSITTTPPLFSQFAIFNTPPSPLTSQSTHSQPLYNLSSPERLSQEPTSFNAASLNNSSENTPAVTETSTASSPEIIGSIPSRNTPLLSEATVTTAELNLVDPPPDESNFENVVRSKRRVDEDTELENEICKTTKSKKRKRNAKSIVDAANSTRGSDKETISKNSKYNNKNGNTTPAADLSGPRRSVRMPKKKLPFTSGLLPTTAGAISDSSTPSTTGPNVKPASQKPGRPRGSHSTWAIIDLDDNGRIIKTG